MRTPNLCDLHIHTFYSDGRASPAEVLRHAANIGLTTVAITDHDNTRGTREALSLAAQSSPALAPGSVALLVAGSTIELIPAIEFTCRWDACASPEGDQNIDVLGYFVNLDDPAFQETEKSVLNDLWQRVNDCCARLTAAGYPVTLEEVLVENPRYPGAVQITFTLRRKGYAEDWNTAFALFSPHWKQVRPSSLTINQAIATIQAAGGVAVLAHPVTVNCGDDEWLQAGQLAALVEMGLDGLEVYHYRLDAQARAHFVALARQFDLLVTGGSDEHGWRPGFPRMGSQPVTPEMVQALRVRSLERWSQK